MLILYRCPQCGLVYAHDEDKVKEYTQKLGSIRCTHYHPPRTLPLERIRTDEHGYAYPIKVGS